MGIAVRHLCKQYGSFTALDDVSVEVPDGSLTALLGPSGSGKSTLLRAIAGLEEPDRGEVVIDGQVATGLPPQRRNVGFVFQHYAAFKHMTVRDNVGFGAVSLGYGLLLKLLREGNDPAAVQAAFRASLYWLPWIFLASLVPLATYWRWRVKPPPGHARG